MTSVLYRNAISAALLVVALVGVAVQLKAGNRGLEHGLQGHFVLAGYILVAIYAGASIAVRLRATRDKH
ncbi:MAG: hypothetical protein ACLPYS_13780 [Vulcanimicrobiaceae bacterium]